jgi:hypothetical protein
MLTLLPKGVLTYYLKHFRLKIFPFANDVNNPGGAPWAENNFAKLWKILNRPQWDFQGLRGNGFMKKPEVENLLALAL